MGITTKELAQICGVSRTTVDRALKGKSRISAGTRDRILAAAEEHGYRPDLLARSLITGRTMHIGVVVFDIRNYYFAELLNGIEGRAARKGYFININLQEEDKEKEISILNSMIDRRVDGIILCPVNSGAAFAGFLRSLPVPVVVIGNYISREIPFVGIDEKKAAFDAADLLIKKGYRRIVFVCPPLEKRKTKNVYSHERRLAGFEERIRREADIGSMVVSGDNYIEKIKNTLSETKSRRTAFFGSGDIYALSVMKYFHERGVRVPRDAGVMGFDNIRILEYFFPPLTTVSYALDRVAEAAVDSLVSLMNGEAGGKHIILEHEIIAGATI